MEAIHSYKYRAVGKDPLTNIEHAVDEAEILFVHRGEGYFIIDDTIFPIRENYIFFIKENTLHYSAPESIATYIRSAINLSASYLNELAEIMGYEAVLAELFQAKCIPLDPISAEEVEVLFPKLKSDDRKQYAKVLLQILDCSYKASKKNTEHNLPDNKTAEIISYINRNITNKLTLDNLSTALFINKFYLCHIFKKTTGVSITKYILMQRLSMAKEKLRTTDLPISQLALECGFSSFSYFSRIFKENEGLSAREYRQTFSNHII